MHILVTANKGGVGCSTLSFLIATLLPQCLLFTNDPWCVPDENIVPIKSFDDVKAYNGLLGSNAVYDISMVRDSELAFSAAKLAKHVLIPCTGNMQSIHAAIELYKAFRKLKKDAIIVVNGYDNKAHREELLMFFASRRIRLKDVITFRHSRLANRILRDGAYWLDHVSCARGLHRLNRTLEIYRDILRRELINR